MTMLKMHSILCRGCEVDRDGVHSGLLDCIQNESVLFHPLTRLHCIVRNICGTNCKRQDGRGRKNCCHLLCLCLHDVV